MIKKIYLGRKTVTELVKKEDFIMFLLSKLKVGETTHSDVVFKRYVNGQRDKYCRCTEEGTIKLKSYINQNTWVWVVETSKLFTSSSWNCFLGEKKHLTCDFVSETFNVFSSNSTWTLYLGFKLKSVWDLFLFEVSVCENLSLRWGPDCVTLCEVVFPTAQLMFYHFHCIWIRLWRYWEGKCPSYGKYCTMSLKRVVIMLIGMSLENSQIQFYRRSDDE